MKGPFPLGLFLYRVILGKLRQQRICRQFEPGVWGHRQCIQNVFFLPKEPE